MTRIRVILQKAFGYGQKATEFMRGMSKDAFLLNEEKQYAVCMALLQLGEMAALIPDSYRDEHPDVPWRQIKGLRNIIAHTYSNIDAALIWTMVSEELPAITESLQKQFDVIC
jgi:uncharacterized protein with HEPN domain